MMTDDVAGCACYTPRTEDDTPATSGIDAAAPVASDEGVGSGGEPADSQSWVPESCTLPTAQQPVRIAEFDRLFTDALRTLDRLEPRRLRLVLDLAWEVTARDVAERESRCCALFTFAITDHDGDLHLDITVPASHEPILDALAHQAAAALPEGTR